MRDVSAWLAMGDGGLLALNLIYHRYLMERTTSQLKMILLFSPYLVNAASTEETRVETVKDALAILLFEMKLLLSGTLMIYL